METNKNPYTELKQIFYMGKIKDGLGKRDEFQKLLHEFAFKEPKIVKPYIAQIGEITRYDNLYCLIGTPLEVEMWEFIRKQVKEDLESKTPSNLGKWLKSENTSSPKSRALGKKTRIALSLNNRAYRKLLKTLRSKIGVVEQKMCLSKWNEIDFDNMPKLATKKYQKSIKRYLMQLSLSEEEKEEIRAKNEPTYYVHNTTEFKELSDNLNNNKEFIIDKGVYKINNDNYRKQFKPILDITIKN